MERPLGMRSKIEIRNMTIKDKPKQKDRTLSLYFRGRKRKMFPRILAKPEMAVKIIINTLFILNCMANVLLYEFFSC